MCITQSLRNARVENAWYWSVKGYRKILTDIYKCEQKNDNLLINLYFI